MRAKAGWAVVFLGVIVALLGIFIMAYLGPDGRKQSGPHPIDTSGIAIVTSPKVLSWVGVRIEVLAELPANKPVFVGLGNAVDVDNYLKKTRRVDVDSFHTPWTVKSHNVAGRGNVPAAPTSLDWWLAKSAGLGGAHIDTTLPDQTVRLAVLSVGSSNLRGLKLTIAYGVRGGFAKGAGLALIGIAGICFGRIMSRVEGPRSIRGPEPGLVADPSRARPVPVLDPAPAGDPTEIVQVIYVYVDEDGVEHEVSEDELGDYEIVDEEES